ncbi:MAG: metallophosphoesterase [Kofleriaceae bacterium]
MRRYRFMVAIYFAAHVYIWWRLVLPLPSPVWQVGSGVIALLAPSMPILVSRRSRVSRRSGRATLLVSYLWFGFAAYLLLGAFASHVAHVCGMDARAAAQMFGLAAIAVVVLGLLNVARGPIIKRVQVSLPRFAGSAYTIAHLTDVHIGTLIGREFVETLVRRVNALSPDLIVITGDLIDGRLSDLQDDIAPLRDLRARDGVFAVTGNHEYYWNVEPWLRHLGSLGIRVLRNEHVTIRGALELAGVDDASYGEDVPRAVAGCDPKLPLVLLAHHPRTVARAMKAGVDLQLSGHTHGGQLLPWGWLARLWDPLVSGLGRFGTTWLYVSDGTGYWGPPLRVGTSCEIAAITLTGV